MTSRGLRVVVLATTLPARRGDGTPEFVLTLAEGLVDLGVGVTVVAPRVRGATKTETVNGVRIRRFAYFPAKWEDVADGAIIPNLKERRTRWLQVPFLMLAMLRAARRAVRDTSADVVHAHWVVPGGVIASLLGRPYIVTAHGADVYALRGRLFSVLKKLVLRRARVTVPVSRSIGERLDVIATQVADPVPMGVDIKDLRDSMGERRPDDATLLFVGRLADKKGVDDVIRALALVPSCVLRVVGDGPSRATLEGLARQLDIAHRVSFLGQRSRAEVARELATARLLLIASKAARDGDEDGVPVVLAEGVAAGVPMVVTDAGGLGEHIVDGTSGWVVPAGDWRRLAGAMKEALGDPDEACRRAATATTQVLPALDSRNTARRYAEILELARR